MSTSTALLQVLARILAVFTGVMLAGFVAAAYVELVYIPGLVPGSMTSTAGLWQLAVATIVGGALTVVVAMQQLRDIQPPRDIAPQPAQAAVLPN